MMNYGRVTALMALSAALGIAGCSGKPEAKAPLNETGAVPIANESDNATADVAPATNNADHPPVSQSQAASEPVGDPNALPPIDSSAPSAQVREDADASGMTARLPDQSGEPSAPPPQPAQQKQ